MAQLNHTGEQLDAAIAAVLASYKDVSAVDAQPADVVAGKKYVKADGTVTEGTLVVPSPPSGNQDITTTDQYDVSAKATARISAAERAKIIPGNIKKNVVILGVTGTHDGQEIDWIDGGELTIVDGHAYAQMPQGTFADITRLSIIQGVLDDESYEATLMDRGQYSAKFGCVISHYFYELVIDFQDDLTVTQYDLTAAEGIYAEILAEEWGSGQGGGGSETRPNSSDSLKLYKLENMEENDTCQQTSKHSRTR